VKTDGVRFAGDATAKADDIDLQTRRMPVRRVHRPLDLGIGPRIDDGFYKGIGQKGDAATAVVKATEVMIAKP